jgi:hypothetical protein
MRAFYGIDLHWKEQFRGLFNVVQTHELEREAILSALSKGDYLATKDDLQLPSGGDLSESLIARFEKAHARSDRLRRLANSLKTVSLRAGLTPPAAFKAHLRRIF